MASVESLFKNIDCLELYVSDLQKGIEFYCDNLGLRILWKTDTTVGLGMANDIAEIVIQNERRQQEVDIKVESVIEAVTLYGQL
jgi:lactoylglutathione lyase